MEGRSGELYRFRDGRRPRDADILTLCRQDALNAWKVGEELVIEPGEIIPDAGGLTALKRARGPEPTVKLISRNAEKAVYGLSVPPWDGVDCFLRLAYDGDMARLYEDGKVLADDFFVGPDYEWEIGLKRFGLGKAHDFCLEILPLASDAPIFLEKWPEMEDGSACRLKTAKADIQVASRTAI
jgi:hypothetical protein